MFQFCIHCYPNLEQEVMNLALSSPAKQSRKPLILELCPENTYNFVGTQFYAIPKSKPISRLELIAKTMIKEALPIKCLEAVVLAMYAHYFFPATLAEFRYLTRKCVELQRFTISFKSIQGKNKYSHIVLGVCCRGRFGAVGLSRRSNLMFRPLKYNKLSELVDDFLSAYSVHGHEVLKINISSAIPHSPQFLETINWDFTFLPNAHPDNHWVSVLDEYARIFCISPLTIPPNSVVRSYVTPQSKRSVSLLTAQRNANLAAKRSRSPLRLQWNAPRWRGAGKSFERFHNNLPIRQKTNGSYG
ncbi:Tubulinyl-Tyr carboxypeptidase 1, partial [Taenia solium]